MKNVQPRLSVLFEVFGDVTAVCLKIGLRRSCLQEGTGLVCSLSAALLKNFL